MRKLILIVHISLDGYVAAENGSFENFNPSPENLDMVNSFTTDADGLLVGRKSFEMLDFYWPDRYKSPDAVESEINYSKWYNATEKIVLSGSLVSSDVVTVISDNMTQAIREIKSKNGKNVLMFGSPTSFSALSDLDVIDEYCVILYPNVFGGGIQWQWGNQKKLRLLKTRQLTNGELMLHYQVEK